MAVTYRWEPLGAQHDRVSFASGNDDLDRYFREQAGQDQKRGVARPFVVVEIATGAVAGYYTLSATSVDLRTLPAQITKRMPRYPTVPTTLLGRLARDLRYRGRGIGELLLSNALRRSYDTSQQVASVGVVVDAIDDGARAFYEGYGFSRFPDQEYRLILPMRTIKQLLDIQDE